MDYQAVVNAIDNLPTPVIITNPDMSIRYVNPAFEKLTGLTQSDVYGARAPYPWWPEERRQEYQAELQLIRSGKKHKSDWLFRRKDGKDFWVRSAAAPVIENGEVKYLLASWVDITENKDREIALQAEVAKMNDAKLQLTEDVLHKLRNPLTSIKGYIGTLLQTDLKWNQSEAQQFLKDADAEADRMKFLLDDLLIMASIEAGKLILTQRVHKVSEILDAADRLLRRLTVRHLLKINIRTGLPEVYVDKCRIVQVLASLVENAAKYSPAGTTITIDAQVSGDRVVMSVEDRGSGIEPESLEKIFNRFYGVERTEAGRLTTVGLGLPISKGIVEAHGGKIRAERVEEGGTKISFTIPVVRMA